MSAITFWYNLSCLNKVSEISPSSPRSPLLCTDQLVKYQHHIGRANYVSVTIGFKCVDFRTFFIPYGGVEPKPTKKGIALRIPEWIELLRLVGVINNTLLQPFPATWN